MGRATGNIGPSLETGQERLTPDPDGDRAKGRSPGGAAPAREPPGGPRSNAAWGKGAESQGSPHGRSPPGGMASNGPLAVTARRAEVRGKGSSRRALNHSPHEPLRIKPQPEAKRDRTTLPTLPSYSPDPAPSRSRARALGPHAPA
ncbi:unnamed protein product [Gulo gulo]|uniref:Uncharacterized protein n=1 Tax=Gulo gulo TaxID=48420 RepID=A0A9X9Q6T9_GULGU|nr:unnamed protein product [Gulo gulo]